MVSVRATEQGFAVFLTMGLVAMVSAIALALVMATSTESRIAARFQRGLEARYAAEAGAHRALIDLALLPDWTAALDGSSRSAFTDGPPSGVRRLADGSIVDFDVVMGLADCGRPRPCSDAERTAVTGQRPWGPDNPRWRPYAYGPIAALLPASPALTNVMSSPGYVIVLVADDQLERDANPLADAPSSSPGAGVVRVRAEAFGPGHAHRVVEAVIARPASRVPAVRIVNWRPGG
jgi:hypothetical protein